MKEFMNLYDQEQFTEAITIGSHFCENWLQDKYQRGAKDVDARPST